MDREDLEQVDSLRYTWQRLQGRALDVTVTLLNMQPAFQDDLRRNLERFRQDNVDYCHEYRTSGPMMPGLTPREASDRLILFQNRFDGMWRKLQAYQSGEELFGLSITDYPELAQIRKELNLLQKLYKLYNDVIDRVSSYYDIPWGEVNIEEINNELMEFQNRCRKLPKGLKVSQLAAGLLEGVEVQRRGLGLILCIYRRNGPPSTRSSAPSMTSTTCAPCWS